MVGFLYRLIGKGHEQRLLGAIRKIASGSHTAEFSETDIFDEAGFADRAALEGLVDKRLLRPVEGKAGVYNLSMKGLR